MKDKRKANLFVFEADVCVKSFQIVFGMLVIGMFIKDEFNLGIFIGGLTGSFMLLTAATTLFYNGTSLEEE